MMKRNWLSRAAVLLATAGGMTAGSMQAEAAMPPYEYDFAVGTETYNNDIDGVKEMVLRFDHNIEVRTADRNNDNVINNEDLFIDGFADNPIYVVQSGGTDRINVIKEVELNEQTDTILITFKNLEYLDVSDPDVFGYELKIDANVLRFDQGAMTLPFNIYDILPGFSSTFVETSSTEINENIFKFNAPRDVFIHIPKAYIQTVETIHRYRGITDRISDPALTNIDILADEEAAYLNVTLGNSGTGSEFARDLVRRTDALEGFTMGQAGIDALVCAEEENCEGSQLLDAFTLKAYNQYGRLLETKPFRLRVADTDEDFFIDNYFAEPTDEFGQTFTLFDLMSEKEVLENILTRMPVEDFNKIGVTYHVGGGAVEVADEEQLQMALDNPNIHTINFRFGSEFDGTWTIDRSLILNTNGAVFNGAVNVGTGSNIDVKINGGTPNTPDSAVMTTIEGLLTIDVGVNGTIILNNVDAQGGSNIISGGMNSVHLDRFSSASGIDLTNNKPIRIVSDEELQDPINIKGKGDVTLSGGFKQVIVTETATMYGTPNLHIGTLNVAENKKLLLIGPGLIDTPIGTIERQNNQNVPTTMKGTLSAKTSPVAPGESTVEFLLTFGTIQSYDVSDVQWAVQNPSVFGSSTMTKYNNADDELVIEGLQLESSTTKTVVLQGSKNNMFFEVSVPITLNPEK